MNNRFVMAVMGFMAVLVLMLVTASLGLVRYEYNPTLGTITFDDFQSGIFWGDPIITAVLWEPATGELVLYADTSIATSITGGVTTKSYNVAPGVEVFEIQPTTILGGANTTDALVYGGGAWVNQGGATTFKNHYFGDSLNLLDHFGFGLPAPAANIGNIYADNVIGVTEVFVQDSAGNVTQLSTHEGDVWKFESTNRFTGRTVKVDMEAAMLALELLTGEDLVEITVDTPELDWDANEIKNREDSLKSREAYFRLNPEGTDPPEIYEPQGKPQWLIDRMIGR